MAQSVLTDKNIFPKDEIIFSFIGKYREHWLSLFNALDSEHPEFTKEWRYYNDGKSWLMKVVHKKKTVFWLSVIEGTFRITAYFTDKAAGAIRASTLSAPLKEQFETGRSLGKLRPITITFKKKSDVEDARTLIALKLQ